MRNWTITVLTIIAFLVVGAFVTSTAFATERDLGTITKGDLAKACNAAGGDLLGVSDSGSYGCEVGSKDVLILCNKDSKCTGFTAARTRADHNKIMGVLKGTAKAATKPETK
jgi:hypothetical protein